MKKQNKKKDGVGQHNVHSMGDVYNNTSILQQKCNTFVDDCQYTELKEIAEKFCPKKENSILLSESYSRLGLDKRAHRVSECGGYLLFGHEIDNEIVSPKGKLCKSNFCRDRFCSVCSWRRSYKLYGQVSQIMDYLGNDYLYILLTFTAPNVSYDELSCTITRFLKSFLKLIDYKKVKSILKGFFRALEITRNPVTGLYHPHIHSVFAVPKRYLKDYYITHDEWLEMWRKAYGDDSITQVDVRVLKDKYSADKLLSQQNLASAVAEVSKYAVKSSDYIISGNEELTDKILSELSDALYKRRLVSFGGCFKEAFQALKMEDVESDNVDLVHINEKLNPALAWFMCNYGWNSSGYRLNSSWIENPDEHSKRM